MIFCAGILTDRVHAQRDLEITSKARSGNPRKPAPDVSETDAAPIESAAANTREQKRWFARFGIVAAAYHPGASIRTNGQVIPGSTASASSNFTTTFEVGYDVTKNISASLCVGFPPKPHIDGRGTVASLGTLGKVRYGPAIFTGYYRFPRVAGFRPYAGGGAAYAIILKEFDGAVTQLNAHNNWGSVLQVGVERGLTRKLDLFVDFKEVWLSVNADGFLGGNVPVKARVKLDPSLISVGIKFHFR
ncbi:MAG TPA: OmpW family outer membrane protein [Pyrinomonadaceae bacterium]|nr:OmpW family outer membrane protein [Pyrinomonadaceae bacterium]